MPRKDAPPTSLRPTIVGREAFRAYLRDLCNAASVQAVATDAGISPAYLSNILAGRSSIGDSLAARFLYGRRVVEEFVPLDSPSTTKAKTPRQP